MKVLMVHFRSAPGANWKPQGQPVEQAASDSAGTDGVSLEMQKRRSVLEMRGYEVAVCSAYNWAEYPVPALEFDSDETRKMMGNLFGKMVDFNTEGELKSAFEASVAALKGELSKVVSDFSPDILFVHNILALPVHPAATVALTELLRETGLPCAAIHHDILSEGAYKFEPTCDFARFLLGAYFPPVMPNVRHWTINSRNERALQTKGIMANVIPDTMDFDARLEPQAKMLLGSKLRMKHGIKTYDLVLFVGARIVPNKQIEIAGHLAATMERVRQEIVGRNLYNGQVFVAQSRIVLVLAGRPEAAFLDYRDTLFASFDKQRLNWMYVGDNVRSVRSDEEGFYALYPDMYAMADLAIYPTGWEGFGNQLLEAFASTLAVVGFEYPVFKEDIAPKGVRAISLGDSVIKDSEGLAHVSQDILMRAAREIRTLLTVSGEYRSMTDNNIAVGERHFSFDVLRAHLRDALLWADSIHPSGERARPQLDVEQKLSE